jgi:hypothetical protein
VYEVVLNENDTDIHIPLAGCSLKQSNDDVEETVTKAPWKSDNTAPQEDSLKRRKFSKPHPYRFVEAR